MKYCNGLLMGFCLLVSPVVAFADDPVAPASPAESFLQTKDEWTSINAKLDDVRKRFLAAPQTERGELRDEYSKLLTTARAMLPNLRSAAREAYAAAPTATRNSPIFSSA